MAEPAVDAPPDHPATLAPNRRIPLGEKRPPQDYGGPPKETTAGDALLWIPRILLAPVYFVSEYLVREPLGAIDTAVEQNALVPRAIDFFAFGPNHNIGIVPTGFIDFGFRPSIGIYFFYDDFLYRDNALRMSLSTGGERYLKAKVADRLPLAVSKGEDGDDVVHSYLQLEVDGFDRPDMDFFGIGWNSKWDDRGRFEERTAGGAASVHVDFSKGSYFDAWLGLRRRSFTNGECTGATMAVVPLLPPPKIVCSVPTIDEEIGDGKYSLPNGFQGYAATATGARLVLDSRAPRPSPGTGVAADVRGEIGTAWAGVSGAWVSYAARLAGFVDLTKTRRVLGLILEARFVDPLTSSFDVPFTELAGAPRIDYVPDDDMMRGFVPGRLIGRSTLSATLDYEWPVWAFADGTVQLAAGNAFGEHLQDFAFDRARLSFVTGITSPNHRDHSFNLLVGFGTKPIAQRAVPESVRFFLGGTTGF